MTERLPDVMTEEEWQAFIGEFNPKCATGLRNLAMFTLMRDGGLRTCEVLGLQTPHIHKEGVNGQEVTKLVLEVTKGKRPRIAYLSKRAARLLDDWLEKKRSLSLGKKRFVFTTLKGDQMYSSYVREVCARKGKDAGLTWRLHPHALRHTFATDLLEKTGDLALTQDALGHSRTETTRIYAKVRNGRMAEAVMAAHPEPEPEQDEVVAAFTLALSSLTPEQVGQIVASLKGSGE